MIPIRRILGAILIISGVGIGIYFTSEWVMGRSSAEDLTYEEVEKYQELQESLTIEPEAPFNQNTAVEHPEENVQVPSSALDIAPGKKVAKLVVPGLEQKYSIYWGADDHVLKRGVGLFVSDQTTTPDGGGHTVLSGHRDTVFYRMDELKEKDQLSIEYEDNIYTYQINKIFITTPDDRTVIVQKEKPTLTLTTCYPFNYTGDAPERYIIQGELINVTAN